MSWWSVFRRDTVDVDDRRGGVKPLAAAGAGAIAVVLAFLGIHLTSKTPHVVAIDQVAAFAQSVLGDNEDVWRDVIGAQYKPPHLVLYDAATVTHGCGPAKSAMGPFYCPSDQTIYLDPSFFAVLRSIKACKDVASDACSFSQAYVIAHEHGHHVQNLLGLFANMKNDGTGPGTTTVRLELQADCFAGVWAGRSNTKWHEVTPAFVTAAWEAAYWGGDDSQGASPSEYTHGTSAQRTEWFLKGYDGKVVGACNTWQNL